MLKQNSFRLNREIILQIFIVVFVFVSLLLLRVPLLHEHHNSDEILFLTFGRALWENGVYSIDYSASPIFSSYFGLAYSLSGTNAFYFRIIVTVLLIINAILIAIIGRRFKSSQAGVIAAFIFLMYMGLPVFQGHYMTKELYSNLWMTMAVLLVTFRRTALTIFLLGICVGFGFVSRQTFVLLAIAIFIWRFLLTTYPNKYTRLQHITIFIVATLIPVIGEFVWAAVYGQLENHIMTYKILMNYGGQSGNMLRDTYLDNLFKRLLRPQAPFLVPLFITSFFGLYRLWRMIPKDSLLFLLWSVAAATTMAITGEFYLHYSQVLVLPLSLLSGFGISDLFNRPSARQVWLPGAVSVLLLLLWTIYWGHPHLPDYLLFAKGDISLRKFWKLNNMPDWTTVREGAFFLKNHMRDGERYFAWTTTPFYFFALGPSALSHHIRDIEMLPVKNAYLETKSFSWIFDYRANQQKLLKIIRGSRPPEWMAVQISDYLPGMIFAFPELFSEIAAKYKFVTDTGTEVIYKIHPAAQYSSAGPIPMSLLVRCFRIDSITFFPDKIDFAVGYLNDLQRKKVISYPINSRHLLNDQESRTILLKDIFLETDRNLIFEHLKSIGLIISNVDFYLRDALLDERAIPRQPDSSRLLLTTTIDTDIRRIFIETPTSTYEGPGVLGRLFPVYQKEEWPPGTFLFDKKSCNYSPMYVYAVGSEEVVIYCGYGNVKESGKQLITHAFPNKIRRKANLIEVSWKNYLQSNADAEYTYLSYNAKEDIFPEDKWVPFSKINKIWQVYIIESIGVTSRKTSFRFLEGNILLKGVPKEVEYCVIYMDGELDYVGPNPDGIHRQLKWDENKRALFFSPNQMIPGRKYDLFVLFKGGSFVFERLQ